MSRLVKPAALAAAWMLVALPVAFAEEPVMRFDERKWKLCHENQAEGITQYVPEDEDPKDWWDMLVVNKSKELLGLTAAEYLKITETKLKTQCPEAKWAVISQSKNEAIYEWFVRDCFEMDNRAETARFYAGETATYVIHFATQDVPMTIEQSKKWRRILASIEFK